MVSTTDADRTEKLGITLHDLLYRFSAAAKNVMFDADKSLYELFLGHYPDLNQKELAVCEIIVSALWDIGHTYYSAIVPTTFDYYKEVFSDEKEVECTIKNMIEKGVLKLKIHFIYGFLPPPRCNHTRCSKWLLKPKKSIDFTNGDILREGWMIISQQFSDVANAAFGPNAPN
jgi:hypothetical protein